MRRLPLPRSRAAIVIAAIFSVPIYLATLLVTSLALDKPHLVGATEHPSTGSTEAAVWAAALLAPAILFGVALVSLPLRRLGLYLVVVAAIVMCALLPGTAHRYAAAHAARFNLGLDYVPDSSASNTSSRGEWEIAARDTVASMTHLMLVVLALALLILVWVDVRRRRGPPPRVPPPPETVGAPDTVLPPV